MGNPALYVHVFLLQHTWFKKKMGQLISTQWSSAELLIMTHSFDCNWQLKPAVVMGSSWLKSKIKMDLISYVSSWTFNLIINSLNIISFSYGHQLQSDNEGAFAPLGFFSIICIWYFNAQFSRFGSLYSFIFPLPTLNSFTGIDIKALYFNDKSEL